ATGGPFTGSRPRSGATPQESVDVRCRSRPCSSTAPATTRAPSDHLAHYLNGGIASRRTEANPRRLLTPGDSAAAAVSDSWTPPHRDHRLWAPTGRQPTMPAERVQRRLAAIVSADVVGYSRLMGEDEAGTLGALKE